MAEIIRDIRYAVRLLARTPVVATVAVLTLALGIGANTAIFSVTNALMLRHLPVRDPQQLVSIATIIPKDNKAASRLSVPIFEEIRQHQRVFSGMFLWSDGGMSNFEARGFRYAASLNHVSGEYFSTLGVRPLLGRLIGPEDVGLSSGSSARVAVISYRCWQERYHGDPGVVGETIRVDGTALTIIGVTPEDFTGLIIDISSDATVPLGFDGGTSFRARKSLWLNCIGRLKPRVSVEQAQGHLEALWPGVQETTVPEEFQGHQRADFFARRIQVETAATGNSYLRRRLSQPLTLLMGLVGLVLLIACVNLANLMLARAAGRQRETAVRIALGASRWRLTRQLLTESLLLSVAGAALGLMVAVWAGRILLNLVWAGFVPLTLDTTPDLRVLGFTAGVAGLTGTLFGLAPAWRVSRTNPANALHQKARTVHGAAGGLSKLLVSGQVALSLVLVIGASLFVRSLENLRTVDPGYRREGLLVLQLFPQAGREKIPNRSIYYRELAERLVRLPSVESVSYCNMGPVSAFERKVRVSRTASESSSVDAVMDFIGPGFFHMVELGVLQGREFDWRDDESADPIAIVSENLARRLYGAETPLGQRIDIDVRPDAHGIQIVGVVSNASLWKLDSRDPMAVYIPMLQAPRINQPKALIRAAAGIDPSALAQPARRATEQLGHHYPLATYTLEGRVDHVLAEERLIATLASFFGVLALLLASVGLYGLMSYAVSQRTSEIGVRMALGAQPRNVLLLILCDALWLVLAGIAVGVPIALALSHLVSRMLFGLSGRDPGVIALSAAVLVGVTLLAGYLPARRASRIAPMIALRSE